MNFRLALHRHDIETPSAADVHLSQRVTVQRTRDPDRRLVQLQIGPVQRRIEEADDRV